MRTADFIVDIGPGAGEHGGKIVATGSFDDILKSPESITGAFLRGERSIPLPTRRRKGNGQMIIELDRKRMTAMAEKDIATLNELIADDLVYTHSTARLDTKTSLIGNMQSGSTVYTSVVPSSSTSRGGSGR